VVELRECDLDSWVKRSASRHGFTATGHEVEIVGLCADCRG
jgi:Fe2+ or Zn2+ uptake regulation protein